MPRNPIFLLLSSLLLAAWSIHATAQINIAGRCYSETGPLEGPGITGTVHYDAENKVLTLDNAHISHRETALFNYVDDLRLTVRGDCSIAVDNTATFPALCTNAPMTITGGGRLEIDAPGVALLLNVCASFAVNIEDCTLIARGGTYGIKGCKAGTLAVRNATVRASAHAYDYSFAIGHWGEIVLKDCKISLPAGAHTGPFEGENVLFDAASRPAREVLFEPAPTGIPPLLATPDIPGVSPDIPGFSPASPAILAVYAPDGRRLSAPRPGLNILRMRDGITRKVMWPTQQ